MQFPKGFDYGTSHSFMKDGKEFVCDNDYITQCVAALWPEARNMNLEEYATFVATHKKEVDMVNSYCFSFSRVRENRGIFHPSTEDFEDPTFQKLIGAFQFRRVGNAVCSQQTYEEAKKRGIFH